MIEKEKFFPIGIGTFKLNLEDKENTLKGLLYSVEKGQNFMSTALVYDNEKVVEFLKDFFSVVDRSKIFLMVHLERYIEKPEDVEKQVNKYLEKIKVDKENFFNLVTLFEICFILCFIRLCQIDYLW